MTVKDFLEEDKKLYEREDKLLAEQHKIHDKRADLCIALNKENAAQSGQSWKARHSKILKGAVWAFKKLKKIQGEWYVTFTYSKKGEITTDMDRCLSDCLEWVDLYDMQLVDAPIDVVIRRLIKEREKIIADNTKWQDKISSRLDENNEKYNALPKEGLKEFLRTHAVHDKDSGSIFTAHNLRKTSAGWRVDVVRHCGDDRTAERPFPDWLLVSLLGRVDKNSNIELIEYESRKRS